jgi:alanine dehydrogenase
MALLLSEADVRELLTMPAALEAVETAFRRLAGGSATVQARQRLHLPGRSYLHYMAAGDAAANYMGLKIYTSAREGLRFIVPLFDATSGDLLALIEADYLGQMRTGAASGIATRYMSRTNSSRLGVIGTGLQARTQVQAVAVVRRIESIVVFGRNVERREKFAREVQESFGIQTRAVDSPEQVVRDADILVTATTASNPVVEGKWLKPGTHINAIGANFPNKRELDDEAVRRAAIVAVDSRAQAREESGDLMHALGSDAERWSAVVEFSDIVAGRTPGRRDEGEITLFKSNGIAIEDIVTAAKVYEMAVAAGRGRQVPLWAERAAEQRERGA